MAIALPKTALALCATLALALFALVLLGTPRLITVLGRDSNLAPEDAEWLLSPSARALLEAAYADLGEQAVVQDHWVQLLSFGQGDAGARENRSFVNPNWLTWWYPLQRLRAGVLLDAAGVHGGSRVDDQYLARLLRQVRALPAPHRLHLVALDQRYAASGRPLPAQSAFAVSNDYLWAIAQAHPDIVTPIVSVHPFRPHALAELGRWAGRGVEAVAWMPVLQHIDPADPRHAGYYQALVDHGLTLYTHSGAHLGLDAGNQAYGNPMRYRRALDAGVELVMINAGALGRYPDPDGDGQVPGTELFLRLLRTPEYRENLRGATAAIALRGAAPSSRSLLLQHPQYFDRLDYASDYPLPAAAIAVDTRALAAKGTITAQQAQDLDEIRAVNAVAFDYVLQRMLRLPYTDLGLPSTVFTGTSNGPDNDSDPE